MLLFSWRVCPTFGFLALAERFYIQLFSTIVILLLKIVCFLIWTSEYDFSPLEFSSKMSAKEEAGENHALVACNGSGSRTNETGLHLYPVSEYDSGEGLPYAPVDWPNVGDKWGWRVGKRATSAGTFKDRYLYLPKGLHVRKDGKMNAFRSRSSVKQYLRSEYPSMDINQFFASFSWMIPSKG